MHRAIKKKKIKKRNIESNIRFVFKVWAENLPLGLKIRLDAPYILAKGLLHPRTINKSRRNSARASNPAAQEILLSHAHARLRSAIILPNKHKVNGKYVVSLGLWTLIQKGILVSMCQFSV